MYIKSKWNFRNSDGSFLTGGGGPLLAPGGGTGNLFLFLQGKNQGVQLSWKGRLLHSAINPAAVAAVCESFTKDNPSVGVPGIYGGSLATTVLGTQGLEQSGFDGPSVIISFDEPMSGKSIDYGLGVILFQARVLGDLKDRITPVPKATDFSDALSHLGHPDPVRKVDDVLRSVVTNHFVGFVTDHNVHVPVRGRIVVYTGEVTSIKTLAGPF